MTTKRPLSKTQKEALDVLQTSDLLREYGGLWTTPDCPRAANGREPNWWVGTRTIWALIDRGLAEEIHKGVVAITTGESMK